MQWVLSPSFYLEPASKTGSDAEVACCLCHRVRFSPQKLFFVFKGWIYYVWNVIALPSLACCGAVMRMSYEIGTGPDLACSVYNTASGDDQCGTPNPLFFGTCELSYPVLLLFKELIITLCCVAAQLLAMFSGCTIYLVFMLAINIVMIFLSDTGKTFFLCFRLQRVTVSFLLLVFAFTRWWRAASLGRRKTWPRARTWWPSLKQYKILGSSFPYIRMRHGKIFFGGQSNRAGKMLL